MIIDGSPLLRTGLLPFKPLSNSVLNSSEQPIIHHQQRASQPPAEKLTLSLFFLQPCSVSLSLSHRCPLPCVSGSAPTSADDTKVAAKTPRAVLAWTMMVWGGEGRGGGHTQKSEGVKRDGKKQILDNLELCWSGRDIFCLVFTCSSTLNYALRGHGTPWLTVEASWRLEY